MNKACIFPKSINMHHAENIKGITMVALGQYGYKYSQKQRQYHLRVCRLIYKGLLIFRERNLFQTHFASRVSGLEKVLSTPGLSYKVEVAKRGGPVGEST